MPSGNGPLAARHFHFPGPAANHRAADTVESGQPPHGDGGQGPPITCDGRSGGPRALLETWCEASGALARGGDAAVSRNTARAVRSDLAIFAQWCAKHGLQDLPAEAGTVAAFIAAMAEQRAPATVRRYLASIAAAHRALGSAAPLESPLVRLALRRMHRTKGRRQGQAHGLTWPLRQRLLAAGGRRVIDARNRALLAVAYDTLLRRAELVSLQVADLLEGTAGDATVLVRWSKLDGEGRGEIVWIGPDSLGLVRRWLERGGIADGALFRSVGKGGRIGGALPPGQVARILKAMARKACLSEAVVQGLSGHSTRVGAAQDMIAAGIELPAILQAGRWKTTAMVNRYGERLLARRNGAAQLARLQQRA